MSDGALAEALAGLLAVRGPRRARRARALLARNAPWDDWLDALDPLHVESPKRELGLARLLHQAATDADRPADAARFMLIEARALHRTGSPADAAAAFEAAARALRRHGEPTQAVKADILRVDALGHAGRPSDALRVAARTRGRLQRRGDALWRVALDVNEAAVLRLAGRIEEAGRAFDDAARRFARLGHAHSAAIARTNAAVAHLDLGDGAGARRRLHLALPTFEEGGQHDMALDVRTNLACADVLEGRLGEAIAAFESLAREHERGGLTRRAAGCRLDLADGLRRAGDTVAASEAAQAAVHGFRACHAAAEEVEALWMAALLAPRDVDRERLLRRARTRARVARPGLAWRCRLLLEDAKLARGATPDARTLAAVAAAAARRGDEALLADAALLRAHAALRARRPGRARRHLDTPALRKRGRPWRWVARESAAAGCDAADGDVGKALARLRRIARFHDAVRAGLPGPWLRTTFVREALDPHLQRVELLLARGRARDRVEAHAVLDALAARRFLEREAPRGDRRLATLRKRLEAVYDRLARDEGDQRGPVAGAVRRAEAEARRLERAVADAWRAGERRSGRMRAAALATPRATELEAGTCVVHVWQHRGRLMALVRRREGIADAADLGSRASLQQRLIKLRFHARRAARMPGTRPRALHRSLADLTARLLDPLDLGSDDQQVHWVLAADLPDVPWAWLPIEGVPAAARHRMMHVPAVGVRPRPAPTGRGAVVFAVGEDDLPSVERERADVLAGARRFAGPAATRAALAHALENARVVHVAGHGLDAAEAPPLSALRVADGWFAAADVPPRIGARLVALSACRTGREHGDAGHAWGGLPTALLAAGSRRVLWTADDVHDDAAARFALAFHAADATMDAASAFGTAARSLAASDGHVGALLPFRLSGIA